jgi:hypothetical protein
MDVKRIVRERLRRARNADEKKGGKRGARTTLRATNYRPFVHENANTMPRVTLIPKPIA